MERNYSVEEILKAVSDLQTKKKDIDIKKKNKIKKKKKDIDIKKINTDKKNNSDIPKDTLRLIEEAEKL